MCGEGGGVALPLKKWVWCGRCYWAAGVVDREVQCCSHICHCTVCIMNTCAEVAVMPGTLWQPESPEGHVTVLVVVWVHAVFARQHVCHVRPTPCRGGVVRLDKRVPMLYQKLLAKRTVAGCWHLPAAEPGHDDTWSHGSACLCRYRIVVHSQVWVAHKYVYLSPLC